MSNCDKAILGAGRAIQEISGTALGVVPMEGCFGGVGAILGLLAIILAILVAIPVCDFSAVKLEVKGYVF